MLDLVRTTQFKKDYKLALKRGCNESDFIEVLKYLIAEEPLPRKYLDHPLENSKAYKKARECHINPDWFLIYRIEKDTLILELIRTGSHSDLY